MRTLWVEGSPKGDQSLSTAAAEAFLAAAPRAAVGEWTRFNVWTEPVVPFAQDAAIAKFAPLLGQSLNDKQSAIWQQVLGEIERVRRFDRLVVSTPMWNWSIPHALKAWIDVIVQPLVSFTIDDKGRHVGTLGQGKPCQLILTRSSAYDGRHPEMTDFQQPYLEYLFGMLGYTVDTLVIEPTTRWTDEERSALHTEALARARAAGAAQTDVIADRSV